MLIILIPLLIGSVLTLFTTIFLEHMKIKKENNIRKRQLISGCRARTYLITQILRELAMYKVHKQYYRRASQLEQSPDKEDSFKKHYKKGQEQRMTETKLAENVANYFELVSEYSILTKNVDRFYEHFEKIYHFEHPKSTNFAIINSLDELEKGLETEEKRLNEKYKEFTSILEAIQKEMR